jgi:DNA-binding NarL/FixJ family response regulator
VRPCDDAADEGELLNETVLIVDDHPSFRAMARLALEADGFVVVGAAADGETGVVEALELRPDIVLLDVGLPDITGFEAATRLRDAGSAAAIVLASSRDRSDFGTLVADSGARGLIEKSLLSGDAVRALVTETQARDILARP